MGRVRGINIWRIENFAPVPVPESSHGKFFMGDSYVILKTTALKSGALHHDIHYWLGKDTSQDEAGTAAIKAIELDAVLGGRAVQYREVQGHETKKFLSYFRPCIIPQKGGVASGFKHADVNEHEHVTRLYMCKGKHVVHVKEVVPFVRSSLNHDDIFIVDTKSKIFQFNGSNSSIQERGKALEVVQYIKDTYHDGKCDVAAIEDGKLMADADAGEFWGLFGGFAPLPRKPHSEEVSDVDSSSTKLLCVEKGKPTPIDADSLTRDLLDTNKCYLLDCGIEVYVWIGRNTSLEERKSASAAVEELISGPDRPKCHVIRLVEGFETVMFRSKFDVWPETATGAVSEAGRGKVAALLKRQGLNVEGLTKADTSPKEETEAYIDCTGDLQVWHVNGEEKELLSASTQSKFYGGDCYIFQYAYAGVDKEEHLIGTWFGKKSVEAERAAAISLSRKMIEALKSPAVQTRLYEGNEPIQFFSIFQSFIVFKGGLSTGYKNFITENNIDDETYSEDGLALFRVQGSGPENMQAIQVDAVHITFCNFELVYKQKNADSLCCSKQVGSSLNSSYCYILHKNETIFTWSGNLTTSDDHDLVERLLDQIKPNLQYKPQKEGAETEHFWSLLGGKCERPSQKIKRQPESDPHLFYCDISKDSLKVTEIHNFTQDDLMTEDVYILDCHSDIFVWIGQHVDSKIKSQALSIAEVCKNIALINCSKQTSPLFPFCNSFQEFLGRDFIFKKQSRETPVFIVAEGSEPPFFTRFFTWDSAKSAMHGNSYQRRLTIVKTGVSRAIDKPKRRTPAYGGRVSVTDKSSRSRSMSFSPDNARARGRSPAFTALAANFENPNQRNLSTPPPAVTRLYPKSSLIAEAAKPVPRSSAIAALTASFESSKETVPSKSFSGNARPEVNNRSSENSSIEDPIKEGTNEGEDEDEGGLTIYPYERLTTTSSDPVTDIDVTRRESYLSAAEFKEKFGMKKSAFYDIPKWKQNKLKMAVQLF
ncbi:villin-4-like [Canna indica]|uniref:Villin-4-like n=1 Tax=Canna indica TaxID=4628 RepID=A0AAQ3JQP3_9LILI|nr:villin-4-like [Canna indica]